VRGRRRRASDELELRPDQIVGDSRAEVSADAISAISNRSDAAIIKKTQRWEISYDRWWTAGILSDAIRNVDLFESFVDKTTSRLVLPSMLHRCLSQN
jgi:hypothetical protein